MNDTEIAKRYLPHFLRDQKEPFPIKRIGYEVWRGSGTSRSFDRRLALPLGVAYIVEYAVYFDFDIQHLYDLEHVWVYVDEGGGIVSAESSTHGRFINAWHLGEPPADHFHLRLYLQPGKHAVLPRGDLAKLFPDYLEACGEAAGKDGVLVPEMFQKEIMVPAGADEIVADYIRSHYRFVPTLTYQPVLGSELLLVTMEQLFEEIPGRINRMIKEILNSAR